MHKTDGYYELAFVSIQSDVNRSDRDKASEHSNTGLHRSHPQRYSDTRTYLTALNVHYTNKLKA